MIPKDEREKDKAVCAAATPEWMQGHHVGEPKALCSAREPGDSLLALDNDGMAIFWKKADAAAAVTGRNRLPKYIDALDTIDTRLAKLDRLIADATPRTPQAQAYVDGLKDARRVLRGEL